MNALIKGWMEFKSTIFIVKRMFINLLKLMDGAKCHDILREIRWKEGIKCPDCQSDVIIKNGYDAVNFHLKRYCCQNCERSFDDLTDTIFSGSNKSLKIWVVALYLMGQNLSNTQLDRELDLSQTPLCACSRVLHERIAKRFDILLANEVEAD